MRMKLNSFLILSLCYVIHTSSKPIDTTSGLSEEEMLDAVEDAFWTSLNGDENLPPCTSYGPAEEGVDLRSSLIPGVTCLEDTEYDYEYLNVDGEETDACDPSPCGPGTMCMSDMGNPICRCLAGLIPKPDVITGCGPEDMLSETDELPPCPVGDHNYGSETELIAGLTCKGDDTTTFGPKPVLGSDTREKVYIGQLTQYAHGVSGTIFYFKEDNQIMIENFTYDGAGPDAFFWVGTQGAKPSSNGIILPYPFQGEFFDSDDTNAPTLDKAFDGSQQAIELTLPSDLKVSDLKWISVWCRAFEVNFGDFIFETPEPTKENNPDTDSKGDIGCTQDKSYIGEISQYEHGVSGDIYACGDSQLVVEKFTYDGLAPDAFFWVGRKSAVPEANGILLPYPFQGEFYDSEDSDAPILDKAYDGSQPEILLTLPGDLKVSDLKWISVWCREYEVNFGDIIIKDDDENVEENKLDTGSRDEVVLVTNEDGVYMEMGVISETPAAPVLEYCDPKKKTYIGAIEQYEHGVSGDIYACGDDQLIIEKFTYDGLAPDAFFWVGTGGDTPNSNGMILPHPFQGKFYDFEDTNAPILDMAYDGTQPQIVLEMPMPIKVSNLKWISVWCRQYEVNFGDLIIANDVPSIETTSDTDGNPKFGTILLTEDNFKSNVLDSNKMWMVVFIDPTQSGKSIKSEWDQAAMELSGKVNLGKVFSKKLAKLCGVKSFPTIMYFPAGDKSDPNNSENYEGEITANAIVTWALKKHNEKPIDTQWKGNDRELYLAVNYNDLSAVKEALDKGANPNFIHPKFGWTSIHHAAKLGYTEIIKALLSKSGSNPNVKDRFDETPLHYAVVNGHRDIVEFLASNGADVVQELLDT